jgi:hypothetical protein
MVALMSREFVARELGKRRIRISDGKYAASSLPLREIPR